MATAFLAASAANRWPVPEPAAHAAGLFVAVVKTANLRYGDDGSECRPLLTCPGPCLVHSTAGADALKLRIVDSADQPANRLGTGQTTITKVN